MKCFIHSEVVVLVKCFWCFGLNFWMVHGAKWSLF